MKTLIKKFSACMIMGLALAIQVSSGFGEEPVTVIEDQKAIREAYNQFAKLTKRTLTSWDVVCWFPHFINTFDKGGFLDSRYPTYFGLSSTRIAMAPKSTTKAMVNLLYILEFPEKKIGVVPESIRKTLAAFYKIDLTKEDLYAGLKKKGVENIFITACGVLPTLEDEKLVSDFYILPHGFSGFPVCKGESDYGNSEVLIGLFENNGVKPVGIQENVLAQQKLTYTSPYIYSKDLEYQVLDKAASFYIAAVTPDGKNVLITHVTMVNIDTPEAGDLSQKIIITPKFVDKLQIITGFSQTLTGIFQQAFAHMARELAILSGNAPRHAYSISKWYRLKSEVALDGRIIVNGPASTNDYIFDLPLTTFKKGECIAMRGTLKNGTLGFGLLSSDRKKWIVKPQDTSANGGFVLSLTPPEAGSYIPMVVDRSSPKDKIIECEVADISVY